MCVYPRHHLIWKITFSTLQMYDTYTHTLSLCLLHHYSHVSQHEFVQCRKMKSYMQ
jgi:hypothetical protein